MRHALFDRHREADDPGNDREVAEGVHVTGSASHACRRLPGEESSRRPPPIQSTSTTARTGGDYDQGAPRRTAVGG